MNASLKTMLRGKQGRFALFGVVLGLAINVLAFSLDVIILGAPFTWAAFIEQHRYEPLHYLLDAAPIILAWVMGHIGRHQDELADLNADLQSRIAEATEQVAGDKQFFETLLYSNPLAIVILDQEEQIISVNPAFEALFQYSLDEVIGKELDPLITDPSFHHEAVELTKAVLEGGSIQHSAVRLRKDGSEVPVDIYGVQVLFAGSRIGALAIYEDVSERVAYEKKLNQLLKETDELAKTDVLTGLFNRRAIMDLVDAELARAERQGHPFSLALMDIDGFKEINDRFGHLSGDVALQTLADVLNENKRIYDGLGRWGGDEFMVVLPNTDQALAQQVAQRLCRQVAETSLTLANGQRIKLTISAGVASFLPGEGRSTTAASLFHAADQALYRAKADGKNQSAAAP